MLKSRACTQEQFDTEEYRKWCVRMREQPYHHRKQWEFVYIAQSLLERGMLQPEKRGLGFGVGQEPLASLFASYGCYIVASDQAPAQAVSAGWVDSSQHADGLATLNSRGICEQGEFDRLVSFRVVDMNDVPDDLSNFDFVWSSCSLEHLGSITKGMQFIVRSMKCLKPGGVAVHTMEFNASSNWDTVRYGPTVLFRRRDIEKLSCALAKQGHATELNFDLGDGELDRYIDLPPYRASPHLKLKIGRFTSTSFGMIIQHGMRGESTIPCDGFLARLRAFWRVDR
jgi:2-polyprenyl-3-methyl-5-hydroxy-6-metoxy-1,4-benzoquinol methylase